MDTTRIPNRGVPPAPAQTTDVAIDAGPTTYAQWGAIFAGSLAGFAATIIMTTLGAAIGVTAGAAVADDPGASQDPGRTALGFSAGAAVWMFISALVVGFTGGAVLNRMARYDRPYMPLAFGALTWAGGVALALLVAAPTMAGLTGSLGAGAAAAASNPEMRRTGEESRRPGLQANGAQTPGRSMTEEEKAQAAAKAEDAAKAAAAAAWVLLGTQLISLAATMLAARWRKARDIPVKLGARPVAS